MKTVALSILIFLTTFKGQAQNTGLDPTFGNDGIVLPTNTIYHYYEAIALQSDMHIIVGGGGGGRFTSDGIIDLAFGTTPGVVVAVQPDDKVLAGSDNQLSRRNPDGTVDLSFDEDGTVNYFNGLGSISTAAILIQPDNKIVMVGTGNGYSRDSTITWAQEAVILIRYHADGRIDSSFGTNGIVTDAALTPHFGFEAKGAALQPDGKIIVGVRESTAGWGAFTATRYMSDGRLDTAFGNGGYARAQGIELLNAIALQSDGKIALAGANFGSGGNPQGTPFLLARFNADGSPDNTLGPNGVRLYYWPDGGETNKCWDMIALPGNKLLLGGRAWNAEKNDHDLALLRLLPDGNPDPAFGNNNGYLRNQIRNGTDEIKALALQPDGKILAGGASDCEQMNCPTPLLVRYMPDGKTATNEPETSNDIFKLYPNPTADKVHIESKSKVQKTVLCDMTGRILYANHTGVKEVSLQSLQAGVYILNITDATNHVGRFKVVKN